ncbi:luciferase family protein [Actinomadura scrupuli]|uniref:luciferase domain-containing protein n=1 Tax=Actinomadura scrupuli TaxID=559629 RepID=UPI003D9880B3
MGAIPHVEMSFAGRAVEQLRRWPALTLCRAESGAGRGLALSTRQIVHLHGTNEAELYLTAPVIERMRQVLLESGRVRLDPGGGWVRVSLDSDSDVRLLVSLVSVAIKANVTNAGKAHRRVTPCPRVRVASKVRFEA